MKIAWWSAGVTSAIACKLSIEKYKDIEIIYIETGSSHDDNKRFKEACEKWYDKEIKTIRSPYKNVFDVIVRDRYINGAYGARCTFVLKRKVRQHYEYGKNINLYVWGFHYSKREIARTERIIETMPNYNHYFPLQEKKLSKENCHAILKKNGIEEPAMYKLGYNNNNCIGCVKGGKGYWNKIRDDFPEVFLEMSRLEREIGRSCIKNCFLDSLQINEGHKVKPIIADCSIFCG